MASSDFTGSAGPRVAKKKSGARNFSAELADVLTRLEDVRTAVISAIDSLRGQNIRIDFDVAAALQRRVQKPLSNVIEQLGKLAKRAN